MVAVAELPVGLALTLDRIGKWERVVAAVNLGLRAPGPLPILYSADDGGPPAMFG